MPCQQLEIHNPFYDKVFNDGFSSEREALQAARKYSWAIPTNKALSLILKHSPIIEIGAGTGYWARLLMHAGATVVAYDASPFKNYDVSGKWFDVRKGTPKKIQNHPSYTLFVCMPVPDLALPFTEGFAKECLKYYTGEFILYAGVGASQCLNKDDTFAEHFPTLVWQHTLPRFIYLDISLYCYKR